MNRLNNIINNQKDKFNTNKLYLLDKPCDDFGFFYQNGIVYFAQKSDDLSLEDSLSTAYLDMNLGVYISSDCENYSFETGHYDMISFKDKLDGPEFDVFYNICVSYALDSSDLSFADFFKTLIELFKKSSLGATKNLIGLLGELFFIKKIYEDYEINVADSWHLTGGNSKFDFSFENFNIEVKTSTSSDMTFLLKHNQIFNNQANYIAIVSLIDAGEGESLETLIDYFVNNDSFKNNVKFQIAINKELLKISEPKDFKKKYLFESVYVYDCNHMDTIKNIPACISDIQYNYNFSDLDPIDIDELFESN